MCVDFLVLISFIIILTVVVLFKLHSLFIVQFLLAIAAILFGSYWFITGFEPIQFNGFWGTILQRGSLTVIESVTAIVGIGNILFGWIYTERDKITLGKSQTSLIQHKFGYGYAASVVTHFAMTVLCLLFSKTGARGGALFAFSALLWGCIPQALICTEIAMNKEGREDIALSLWKESTSGESLETKVSEMIEHLNNSDTYSNKMYWDTLCEEIANWLKEIPKAMTSDSQALEQTANNIVSVSIKLRSIMDKVPKVEQDRYGEFLLETICSKINGFNLGRRGKYKARLLGCAYLHFLYGAEKSSDDTAGMEMKVDHLSAKITALAYYSTKQNVLFRYIISYLRSLLIGLEWYMFLKQKIGVPRYMVLQNELPIDDGSTFAALVFSMFGEKSESATDYPMIAWTQVLGRK